MNNFELIQKFKDSCNNGFVKGKLLNLKTVLENINKLNALING